MKDIYLEILIIKLKYRSHLFVPILVNVLELILLNLYVYLYFPLFALQFYPLEDLTVYLWVQVEAEELVVFAENVNKTETQVINPETLPKESQETEDEDQNHTAIQELLCTFKENALAKN